jgi:hypothetical protein
MPAPASMGVGAQSITAAQVLNGIVVCAGSGAAGTTAITLPTAPALAAAMRAYSSRGVIVGDTVEFLLINGNSSTGSLTVTAPGGGGVTFDGNQNATAQIVAAGASKLIYCRFTAGTPIGSETYVVYS